MRIKKINLKRNDYIAICLFISILIFLWFFIGISEDKSDNKILSDKGISIGLIYDYYSAIDIGSGYLYSFTYKNKIYKGEHCLGEENRKMFLRKKFIVIFERKNPKNNMMLIYPRDFKRYNMKFPDSLNWLKKYEPKNLRND